MIRQFRGWKIMPLICYDLRFPAWSRNRYDAENDVLDYDLLIYVANWPKPRTEVWNTLLRARSMENLCFSIGLNRIGKDGEGVEYDGHSAVYDFKGQAISSISDQASIETVELDLEALQSFRKKFPNHLDWDHFEIGHR